MEITEVSLSRGETTRPVDYQADKSKTCHRPVSDTPLTPYLCRGSSAVLLRRDQTPPRFPFPPVYHKSLLRTGQPKVFLDRRSLWVNPDYVTGCTLSLPDAVPSPLGVSTQSSPSRLSVSGLPVPRYGSTPNSNLLHLTIDVPYSHKRSLGLYIKEGD